MNINEYIDHTALKSSVTKEDIEKLCNEALEHKFAAVCVNSTRVELAKKLLANSDVNICTVVGFPIGASFKEVKAKEALMAIELGADEIDMVIDIQSLIDKDLDKVRQDIEHVLKAVHSKDKILKVIIETCLLNEIQKREVCLICKELKVDFVKTSTGFSTGGATLEDVKFMKDIVGDSIKVKASGGVKNKEDAIAMIKAGASRIGTSSGVSITQGEESSSTY